MLFLLIETVINLDFAWKRRHNASASEPLFLDVEYLVSIVPVIEMILDFAIVVFRIPSPHELNFEMMTPIADTVTSPRCS